MSLINGEKTEVQLEAFFFDNTEDHRAGKTKYETTDMHMHMMQAHIHM